jgi:hypothetical protein
MDELKVREQKESAGVIISQAQSFVVKNQQDYDNAAEICKDIKIRIKQVEEYWKPLKEAAAKHHKDICAKEKELLSPFTAAETEIKGKMVAYQKQKLEEERLLKEEQERFRKEEEARLLALAVKAEQEGKTEHSEFLMEQAEEIHTAVFELPKQVKTIGTAVKTTWKARVINESLVPVSIAGALIRPVDLKVLNDFARASKGNMAIPGVEFYEDINISVSRG